MSPILCTDWLLLCWLLAGVCPRCTKMIPKHDLLQYLLDHLDMSQQPGCLMLPRCPSTFHRVSCSPRCNSAWMKHWLPPCRTKDTKGKPEQGQSLPEGSRRHMNRWHVAEVPWEGSRSKTLVDRTPVISSYFVQLPITSPLQGSDGMAWWVTTRNRPQVEQLVGKTRQERPRRLIANSRRKLHPSSQSKWSVDTVEGPHWSTLIEQLVSAEYVQRTAHCFVTRKQRRCGTRGLPWIQ